MCAKTCPVNLNQMSYFLKFQKNEKNVEKIERRNELESCYAFLPRSKSLFLWFCFVFFVLCTNQTITNNKQ